MNANNTFLPYGRQTLDSDDIRAVTAALQDDYLTTGPKVAAFEAVFAEHTGASHAIACSSGTAALHLAAMTLDFTPGDAVVVPSVTFLATASTPHLCGATVVFADVNPDTGLMEAVHLHAALRRVQARGLRVRAVLPVHLNGRCVDLSDLHEALHHHPGVVVIEDACHALGGVQTDGTPVGSCSSSLMAAFSLHPVKMVTTGEGGVVTCNDESLASRLRDLRNHGMLRDPDRFVNRDAAFAADGKVNPWYYEMHAPGLNYRLPDVACALGSSQLQKLSGYVDKRRLLVQRYRELLADESHVRCIGDGAQSRIGWHLFVALVDFARCARSRAEVMAGLQARGIGTQVHYLPVHRQPYFRRLDPSLSLPGADAYYSRCLSLPLFPAMSASDVERVVKELLEALHGAH